MNVNHERIFSARLIALGIMKQTVDGFSECPLSVNDFRIGQTLLFEARINAGHLHGGFESRTI